MEQNQIQQQLLSQLRDIEGLDNISWWPLALGWWAVIGVIVVISVTAAFYYWHYTKKEVSWKKHIDSLFSNLQNMKTTKKKAAALSELLRRLAIHKYGRKVCAGLEGQDWLNWLTRHDPKGFNWDIEGKILVEAPYMPDVLEGSNHVSTQEEMHSEVDSMSQDELDFELLISAAKRWAR